MSLMVQQVMGGLKVEALLYFSVRRGQQMKETDSNRQDIKEQFTPGHDRNGSLPELASFSQLT